MLESADLQIETAATSTLQVAAVEEPIEEVYKKGLPVSAWVAIVWLSVVVVVALLAPVLPLKDPLAGDYIHPSAGILTAGHPLGTDALGRDVLSRAIWGARASVLISVGSIIFGVLIGGLLGLIAGFRGRRTDTALSSLFNILLAFPQLVLALTLVSVLAPSRTEGGVVAGQWAHRIVVMIVAIGIVSIPILGRITRANALAWSQREFVTASRAQGATDRQTMFREVLPNVLPAMLAIALLGVAVVIVLEGALAIFGLSVPAPDPSWGNMIQSQLSDLGASPPVWIVPSVLIFLSVLSLNYLGDVVRARFDVRESAI
jgi:peptide/nickel transport system permease protein